VFGELNSKELPIESLLVEEHPAKKAKIIIIKYLILEIIGDVYIL
jgi:hypothetical protein